MRSASSRVTTTLDVPVSQPAACPRARHAEVGGDGHVTGALDEIPEPMTIGRCGRDVVSIRKMIRRSRPPSTPPKTTREAARRDENSRARIRNVDGGSSASFPGRTHTQGVVCGRSIDRVADAGSADELKAECQARTCYLGGTPYIFTGKPKGLPNLNLVNVRDFVNLWVIERRQFVDGRQPPTHQSVQREIVAISVRRLPINSLAVIRPRPDEFANSHDTLARHRCLVRLDCWSQRLRRPFWLSVAPCRKLWLRCGFSPQRRFVFGLSRWRYGYRWIACNRWQ